MGTSSGRKVQQPDCKVLRTNEGDVIPGEYWLVLFFDRVGGMQYKTYGRLGSLINAVEDHFGYRYSRQGSDKGLPEFHVWHVDIIECTVKPVDGPLWR